jgi:O-antigen/teichoic acid export membrane protein
MNLLKSFSVYAVNNVINASIPILLIPVLTHALSKEEYGMATNVQVFMSFTLPFIMLAMTGAVNTAFFRETKEDFPRYLSSALMVSLGGVVVSLILLLAFSPLIRQNLDIPFKWIILIPFISFFQTICMISLVIFQARKEPIKYGLFQIGITILNFGASVLFVVSLKMHWEGRIYGIMLSFFIFLIIGLVSIRRMGYLGRVSKVFIKDALKFGVPLIPHMISAALIQMLDRLLITHYEGAAINGLYQVAFQIGIAVIFLADAFNKAWIPHMFENLSKISPFRRIKIVKQSYLFMLFFLCIPVALYIFTPLIFKLFVAKEFWEYKTLVLPISIGAAFGGMYYVVANYIFYTKKTWMLAIVTTTAAVISISLNLVFIPKFSAAGAAYTYIIVNVFMFVSVWILANRTYPMPWFTFLKKDTKSGE